MKLKDMDIAQLRKAATKLGLSWKPQTSEEKLRQRITLALKGKPKASKAPPKATSWPKEWPEQNREDYYRQIVCKPHMPADEAQAFAELQEAIETKAANAEPVKTTIGYSCFGLWYTPTLVQCNTACPVMPLCQRICQSRPELKQQVEELEKAALELAQSQKGAAKAAPAKTKAEKKPPKEKKAKTVKADSVVRYQWTGDLEAYDESLDFMPLLKWMDKKTAKGEPRIFTMEAFIKQVDKLYDDPEESAQELLKAIMDENDIRVIGDEAAA